MSIPKVIHYCWFGRGQMPKLALKCIESWKKYCPDYQIKEWNEDNFDLDLYPYVREAYDARKFAFVTDVVRLYALYHEGGIYMDTDVEVIKPLDSLLQYQAVSGFESPTQIPTGLMASEKEHPLIAKLLHEYDGLHFVKFDGTYDLTTNVVRISKVCVKFGLKLNNELQVVKDFTFLPKDYLCPKSYVTGKIELTNNTLCIHHFSGSWTEKKVRRKIKKIILFTIFGERLTKIGVELKQKIKSWIKSKS